MSSGPPTDITILDGGMGKELRRIGAPFRQPEWSAQALIEAPDMVVQAHHNFIDAGAQLITTNNYAVVPYHLGEPLFEERGVELIDLAGRLARRAADETIGDVLVAGSMPPLFGSYEPAAFDPARAAPIYESIARALEPHVDLWIGETLSTIAEMSVIVGAINAAGSTKPVWMSFSLPDEWADERVAIRSGESPRDIATAATAFDDRIAALLFNCSLPEQTGPALIELRAALNGLGSPARVGAYANAFPTTRGDTYQANEVIFERRNELTPERYSEFAEEWIRDGATIVGGCCDMYPEHIHGLAQRFA